MTTRYVPYKPAAVSAIAIALQRPAARIPVVYTTAFVVCLCFTAYLLGTWQRGGDALIAAAATTATTPIKSTCGHLSEKTSAAAATTVTELDFKPHHTQDHLTVGSKHYYPPCRVNYSEYTPCEDPKRSLKFNRNRNRMIYRERHCPEKHELLKCRVPPPYGYRTPFKWPESRDHAWFVNVPHRELTIEKAVQNWIQYDGHERFRFPGGGTMFPNGAGAYIDDIARLINLKDGSIRTAIDTGCGVASFGSYLVSRNIITMSFAPRDTHEAQVQFALERGVPALIGVLASKRLPYPSRAFDMAHCSRCLIPWGQYDGQYLIEVDRVLRPGGYWILSGPPIRWRKSWKGWNRTMSDLKDEQKGIEKVARTLCWKKIVEKNDISIWQKPTNHIHCKLNKRRIIPLPPFCLPSQDPDKAWYTDIDSCLTPLPEVSDIREVAGGKVRKWPERLNAVPPRISQGSIDGLSTEMFQKDIQLWNKRVSYYKSIINKVQLGRYRNLLDMNANMGGFAAALVNDPVWVMNVVPVEAKVNTLGVIYERGLIGTYQSWCEAMSTYPRTYDLIHADSLFSLYIHRCEMEDIMLEMDRILRPEGSMIIRDDVDVIMKVKRVAEGMEYDTHIIDHEDGPLLREKLLFAVKSYWTAPASSSSITS